MVSKGQKNNHTNQQPPNSQSDSTVTPHPAISSNTRRRNNWWSYPELGKKNRFTQILPVSSILSFSVYSFLKIWHLFIYMQVSRHACHIICVKACMPYHMHECQRTAYGWESVLSFHHVRVRDWTQVVRAVSKGDYLISKFFKTSWTCPIWNAWDQKDFKAWSCGGLNENDPSGTCFWRLGS